VNPDEDEVCDSKDNDCNGLIDDGIDYDLDGWSGCGDEDCDDYNASIFPGASEVPYDNIDQDCDGEDLKDLDSDGYDGGAYGDDCDDTDAAIHPDAAENCNNGIDDNCNGIADQYDDECGAGDDDDDDSADDGGVACSCRADAGPSPSLAALLFALAILVRRRLT
jgi:MYXO-CTERM domain-containing protein